MKITAYINICVTLAMAASCIQEVQEVGDYVKKEVRLEIEGGSTKTTLDPNTLNITWTKGDKMLIWSQGTPYYTELVAQSSTDKANFIGEQGQLDITRDMFAIYPSSSVLMQESGYSGVTIVNHTIQTGLLSDFGKYNVSYTGLLTKESSADYLRLSCSDEPTNLLPIIKFTIKEGLDVRSIAVMGLDDNDNSTNIVGNITLNPSEGSVTVGDSGDEIVVYRDGEKINGTVYIFCSPNNATKLRFTFTNSEDKVCEYTNLLQHPLESGVLSDFGSINSLIFRETGLYVIKGGEKWAKLTQKKDIIEGSALDFSHIALDAPAGKYGLLKSVGNHFEFEGKPGVQQVFYGANLTTSACAPAKDKATTLAQRLARIGYNTIRLHHYDELWDQNEADEYGHTYRDRMDFFISELIKNGLYITLDLYSTRDITYSELGFSGSGDMNNNDYKILSLVSAALADDSTAKNSGYLNVYQDWCNFTDSVLDRTNQYTGRKYSEEPALILVTVLNEPSHSNAWENKIYDYSLVQYAWKKCLGDIMGSIFKPSNSSVGSSNWETFVKWVQTNGYANMVKYCREKGYNSMTSVAYDSRCYIGSASGLSSFDVHDSHSYTDHPSGDLPERKMDGENPLLDLPPYVNESSTKWSNYYGQRSGVPHTLTEWNHCTPNPMRAVGALHGSAFLRYYGWDGIWRFAYAQGATSLFSDTTPNAFDVVKDEVMKASEAGVVSFYLRGDMTDPHDQVQFTDDEFTAVTERSVALYKGTIGEKSAGLMTAVTSISPATLLLTSIDGQSLSNSGRMLLANMTDCAGNNATYTDNTKKVTISHGTGQYVRISKSQISLSLNNPAAYKVYELDTDGSRVSEIATDVIDGKLCFTISVRGTDGKAHIYYEITK